MCMVCGRYLMRVRQDLQLCMETKGTEGEWGDAFQTDNGSLIHYLFLFLHPGLVALLYMITTIVLLVTVVK